jgi:hypothetical protein
MEPRVGDLLIRYVFLWFPRTNPALLNRNIMSELFGASLTAIMYTFPFSGK